MSLANYKSKLFVGLSKVYEMLYLESVCKLEATLLFGWEKKRPINRREQTNKGNGWK